MGTSDTHAKTERVPEFRPLFVPKGPVRIAQRFNAGSNGAMRPVPKGRLKAACRESLAQSVFSPIHAVEETANEREWTRINAGSWEL